jgi:hypothetical protein
MTLENGVISYYTVIVIMSNTTHQCPNCCRWFNACLSLTLHISLCCVKHFANDNIIGGGNDTNFPLRSIYRTTDANKSDCLMNDFEVNVSHVGVNVDLADMKSIDSDNSLFGVTSLILT